MSCSCKFFLCRSTFTTQAAASDYRKLAGIYVLPSTDSLFTWHGVIFVRCALLAHGLSCARRCSSHQFRCLVLRSGLYREGVFKFVIRFPDNFPKAYDLDTKVKALAEQAEGTVQSIGALTQKEEPSDYVVGRLMRRVEGCEANFHTSMARFQVRILAVGGRLPAAK